MEGVKFSQLENLDDFELIVLVIYYLKYFYSKENSFLSDNYLASFGHPQTKRWNCNCPFSLCTHYTDRYCL